jgi:hypothetical protein
MILKTIKTLNHLFILKYVSSDYDEAFENELTQFTYSQIQYIPKFVQIGLTFATMSFSILCICFKGKLFYNSTIKKQKHFLEIIQLKQWEPFASMIKFYKSIFLLYFYFKIEPN